MTFNPVTGCLHGCDYCYARKIANRFGLAFAPKLGDPGMEGACKYDSPEGIDTIERLTKEIEHMQAQQTKPSEAQKTSRGGGTRYPLTPGK